MSEDHHEDDKTQTHIPLTKDTIVSHYRIVKKIGAGGMGEVYLAEDTNLRRQAALKFLPHHLATDSAARARFTREAQAVAALKHPNVVTIYEVSEHHGRPFFAMECCEGQSLRDIIRESKPTLSQVVDLAIQICQGLQEAHEAGIIHRDLKPSNIILDKKGTPKLVDFGLAHVEGQEKLTVTGSTLGTLEYMSPEQAEGKTLDMRSDIFSFGVVLYEMITGKRPFTGEYSEAVLYSILRETPEPLSRYKSGVPAQLQQIVDRALEKNVDTRYQTASGMLADLRRLAGPGEVTALTAKKKISRLWWAAAAVVVIVVGVVGGPQIKQWLAPTPTQAKSLAVVDFDNIGSEDDAYLASGLAEDLAVKLRQVKDFQVASSADIRRLARENLLPREIAARLKVQYALGGSLLREDTLVRVNVELIERTTGNVVWSEQIDRQFIEIFQFMDEVSRKIAQALEVRLTSVEKAAMAARPTDDAAAYDHYLKGRHYYYNITFRDNELAEKEFQIALRLDPDYPLALAGLADAYVQRYRERFDYDEYWLDSSKVLIERALALEPDLAEAYESRAEVLLEEDDFTGALEAAYQARGLRPDWDEPYVHLGNIYSDRGERRKAMAKFDTALSIRPSVDALCGRGEILQTRGQMDSAQAAYQAAIQLNPDHDRPYLKLGYLHVESNESEKAEDFYRQAIEARPDRAAGYRSLSYRMLDRGKHQDGENLLREYVKRYPYNWDGYEALYYYVGWQLGDYAAATAAVEEAATRNPERIWPHLLSASCYSSGWQAMEEADTTVPASERAVAAVNRALSLRPNSARVLEWAGWVYSSLNRPEESMAYFDRALKVRPGSAQTLEAMSYAHWIMREYEKSAEFAQKAVIQVPGRWEIYRVLQQRMARLNREQEYLEIIKKAARDYGEDEPMFLYYLGLELCLTGEYEEAVRVLERGLEIKGDPYYIPARLGVALWLSGDTEGALAQLKEATGHWTHCEWVVTVLKSEGRFDEIESFLESIKELTPDRYSGIHVWVWVASAYYRSMRRFDDAIAVYREYTETIDTRVDCMWRIAGCYWRKGEFDTARHILEGLADTKPASDRREIFWTLALLEAAAVKDLTVALKLAEKAQAELSTPDDRVTEPLLRLRYACGNMDDAANTLEQLGSFWVWSAGSHPYRRAQIATTLGSDKATEYLDHAVAATTRLTRGDPGSWYDLGEAHTFLACALARAGRPDEVQQHILRANKLEPERADIAYNSACAYSLMGDTTLALQWLQTAVDRGYLELWWAKVDPDLEPLRELPRFKELMNDWDQRIQTMLAKSKAG